jgi:hypothetical protein
MSLLGKILAVFNVLAVVAFVFIVATDWGQRQIWSYAVYRQDLALDGLPLDAEARDPDGSLQVGRLSDATMQDLFKPAARDLPSPLTPEDKTQVGEVKRVHAKLRGRIEGTPNDDAKRKTLVRVLVPLARTGGERDALRQRIDKKIPTDQLMADSGPFEQAFKTALDRKTPQGQDRDPEERRQAIAHLLFNLNDPADKERFPEAYGRVLTVVGLKAFTNEADLQALALRDMAQREKLLMAEEQAGFETQYQRTLSDLNGLADNVEARRSKLAEHERLAKKQQDLVRVRQSEVVELKAKLDQARQATMTALAQLSAEQQKLFDYERQVTAITEKNQQLEREIRALEKVDR